MVHVCCPFAIKHKFVNMEESRCAQVANHVFLLDPWWNPACEMQAWVFFPRSFRGSCGLVRGEFADDS